MAPPIEEPLQPPVITLALRIGANTAIFSAVHQFLRADENSSGDEATEVGPPF